jgi:hypothetical protein
MTIGTLAGVRELMRHRPKDRRSKSAWQHVADELDQAARGADLADVAIALRVVPMPEHVKFQQR